MRWFEVMKNPAECDEIVWVDEESSREIWDCLDCGEPSREMVKIVEEPNREKWDGLSWWRAQQRGMKCARWVTAFGTVPIVQDESPLYSIGENLLCNQELVMEMMRYEETNPAERNEVFEVCARWTTAFGTVPVVQDGSPLYSIEGNMKLFELMVKSPAEIWLR